MSDATPDQGSAELSDERIEAIWDSLDVARIVWGEYGSKHATLLRRAFARAIFATATQATPSAEPVRMLTTEDVWAVWDANQAPGPVKMASAIQRKFIEVNRLATATQGAPTPAPEVFSPHAIERAVFDEMTKIAPDWNAYGRSRESAVRFALRAVANLQAAAGIHPTPPQAQGSEENRAGAVRAGEVLPEPRVLGYETWTSTASGRHTKPIKGYTAADVQAILAGRTAIPAVDAGKTGESAASSEPKQADAIRTGAILAWNTLDAVAKRLDERVQNDIREFLFRAWHHDVLPALAAASPSPSNEREDSHAR